MFHKHHKCTIKQCVSLIKTVSQLPLALFIKTIYVQITVSLIYKYQTYLEYIVSYKENIFSHLTVNQLSWERQDQWVLSELWRQRWQENDGDDNSNVYWLSLTDSVLASAVRGKVHVIIRHNALHLHAPTIDSARPIETKSRSKDFLWQNLRIYEKCRHMQNQSVFEICSSVAFIKFFPLRGISY